jgi:hypothetical protein
MTEMYVWSMFKGYLAGFYTYPVATPISEKAILFSASAEAN